MHCYATIGSFARYVSSLARKERYRIGPLHASPYNAREIFGLPPILPLFTPFKKVWWWKVIRHCIIHKLFLNFRDSEPHCSSKLYSHRKGTHRKFCQFCWSLVAISIPIKCIFDSSVFVYISISTSLLPIPAMKNKYFKSPLLWWRSKWTVRKIRDTKITPLLLRKSWIFGPFYAGPFNAA